MKINFSTVLYDLPDREGKVKALQVTVELGRYSADGRYVIKEPVEADMTLADLVLMHIRANEAPGDAEKGKMRSNFGLLVRISQRGEVEIDKTEKEYIVDRLSKIRDVVAFGAADEIFNPPLREVAEAKEA